MGRHDDHRRPDGPRLRQGLWRRAGFEHPLTLSRGLPEGAFVPVSVSTRRDVRYGGEWTTSQSLKNALLAHLARGALGAVDHVPQWMLTGACRSAGTLLGALIGRRARNAAARTLGDGDAPRVARACFAHAGENVATTLLLRRRDVRALDRVTVTDDTLAAFRAALARGPGAVFVSAHLGPFELLPAAVSELGLRPAVVVRESYDPRLNRLVDTHRLTRGVDVIHRGSAGAATQIVRALRAGQPVGFLPDFGGRVPSLLVPFLGAERPFPVGPQQIAQRLGVPLLVGGLARASSGAKRSTFRLTFDEIDVSGSIDTATARVARALEGLIESERDDFPWMAVRSSTNLVTR